jgi:hypothetical protein
LAYSLNLKMETICSSETSFPVRTTWRYNPENYTYSSKNAYFVLSFRNTLHNGCSVWIVARECGSRLKWVWFSHQ